MRRTTSRRRSSRSGATSSAGASAPRSCATRRSSSATSSSAPSAQRPGDLDAAVSGQRARSVLDHDPRSVDRPPFPNNQIPARASIRSPPGARLSAAPADLSGDEQLPLQHPGRSGREEGRLPLDQSSAATRTCTSATATRNRGQAFAAAASRRRRQRVFGRRCRYVDQQQLGRRAQQGLVAEALSSIRIGANSISWTSEIPDQALNGIGIPGVAEVEPGFSQMSITGYPNWGVTNTPNYDTSTEPPGDRRHHLDAGRAHGEGRRAGELAARPAFSARSARAASSTSTASTPEIRSPTTFSATHRRRASRSGRSSSSARATRTSSRRTTGVSHSVSPSTPACATR